MTDMEIQRRRDDIYEEVLRIRKNLRGASAEEKEHLAKLEAEDLELLKAQGYSFC